MRRSHPSIRLMAVLALTALLLGGCQVAHMALPQGLQSESSELPVEGRSFSIFDKSFRFGLYQVTNVHRGWTRSEGFSVSDRASEYSDSEAEQKYEFSVNESGRTTWEVQCTTEADWGQLETKGLLGGRLTMEFSSDQQLACTLKQEGRERPAELVMTQSINDETFQGILTDGDTRIDISATHKLATSPLPLRETTGYIFHIEDRPVGAVEVINKGTVWIDGSVSRETRSALAATSAALLLYQDIKKMSQDIKRM